MKKRKPRNWKKVFSLTVMACFLAGYFFAPAFAADPDPGINAEAEAEEDLWTWEILVVPPDEGWENETGNSIKNALSWHSAEVSESGNGIHGHDVEFVLLPPASEDTAQDYVLPVQERTVGILSFASYHVDRALIQNTARLGAGIPLLLAGGENVFLFEEGRLLPFVFALDLYRDYRCRAFADYALKTMSPSARLAVMGSRFTLNEEREAKICYDLFLRANFSPMPYWVDASVTDTFGLIEQEIKEYSDGALVSYVGSMTSKELWRGVMRYRSPYRIWYGGVPDKSFLSFKGMMFADQNFFLDVHGGFATLRRSLWGSRALAAPDEVAAGRANALASWLLDALKALPGEEGIGLLFSNLENAQSVPFGSQLLEIDPATHRPKSRQVYVMEVLERQYRVLETLNVEGLGYYDY